MAHELEHVKVLGLCFWYVPLIKQLKHDWFDEFIHVLQEKSQSKQLY